MFDDKKPIFAWPEHRNNFATSIGKGGAGGGEGGTGSQTRTFLFVNYQLLGVNQRTVGLVDESCYFVYAILSIYTIKINMIFKPVIKQYSLVPVEGIRSSEMDPPGIRLIQKAFIKERGAKVFRKIFPSLILWEPFKHSHIVQLLAIREQISNAGVKFIAP